jgi:hypothetical protein
VTSVGLSLFNYQDDARSNKHNVIREFTAGSWDQHALRYMKIIALKIEKFGAEARNPSCPLKRM